MVLYLMVKRKNTILTFNINYSIILCVKSNKLNY